MNSQEFQANLAAVEEYRNSVRKRIITVLIESRTIPVKEDWDIAFPGLAFEQNVIGWAQCCLEAVEKARDRVPDITISVRRLTDEERRARDGAGPAQQQRVPENLPEIRELDGSEWL
ncbi:MAG: hypothetical protein ACRCWH_07095 [Aeromonas veronii]